MSDEPENEEVVPLNCCPDARLIKQIKILERRLERLEERLQRVLDTNELWDGS